jgi:hypothetical protein
MTTNQNSNTSREVRTRIGLRNSDISEQIQNAFKTLEPISPSNLKLTEQSLDRLKDSFEELRISLEKDSRSFDKNGIFLGWENPYVVQKLCRSLVIKNRFFRSKNSLLNTRFEVIKFIFGSNPYEEHEKSYVPASIANLVSFHSAIQRLGILFALITGLSLGELVTEEPIKMFFKMGINTPKSAKLTVALFANILIFGAATKGSEIFVENQKNKPKPNHIKRLFALASVIAVMKVPLVIMTGIAGTAHEFQPTDKTLNAQIEARTQFERANAKTEHEIKRLEKGGREYFLLNASVDEKEKDSIRKSLEASKYPSYVRLYGEQLYLDYLKNKSVNTLQNDSRTSAAQSDVDRATNDKFHALDFLGEQIIDGKRTKVKPGDYETRRAEIVKSMKSVGAEYVEKTTPKLDFIRRSEIMQEDFIRMTPLQWLDKWLPQLTSEQESSRIIENLKTVDLDEIPAGEKINLVYTKLQDQFNYGGRIPNFFAFVFIALLFEVMSSFTLIILYCHKDYWQKYSNSEFQDSYKSLTDVIILNLANKIKSDNDRPGNKVPTIVTNYGVFTEIVAQLMREKPIPGVTSIIQQYEYETYSPKFKEVKKKKDIEALRAKGVDVRNIVVRAFSGVINLFKKAN